MNDNQGTLVVSNSTFNGNYASTNGSNQSFGGAIYNSNKAYISNSDFFGNGINLSTPTTAYGGAIASDNTVTPAELTIVNSSFIGNQATNKGGAIYNGNSTLNIIADKRNTIFANNYANSELNDITLEGSDLNLNAGNGGAIVFNSGIAEDYTSSININKSGTYSTDGIHDIASPTNGTVVLNAPINGDYHANIYLYSGSVCLGKDNYIDGSNLTLLSDTNGSTRTLSLMNNNIGTMSLHSLAVNANTNIKIDADLAAGTSDKITAVNYDASSTSKLNLNQINILHDSKTTLTNTQLLTGDLIGKNLLTMGVSRIYSPIYAYDVSYNDATGQLAFAGGGSGGSASDYNPAILATPASTNAGAYMTQIGMYNQILDRADLLTAMPYNERLLMKTRNKVAEIGGSDVNPGVFSPIMTQDENGGLWFKEYTTFESVPLSNGGPDVSNIGYGTLIGGDFPMKHYRKGWDGVTTIYVAYNGSHQNYNSVGAYQNGGALGITETLFKGNFFTALTVSAGDSYGQANTMYGVDNFNTLLAGVASKTGYNIKVANDKVVFQPSIFLSYTFANTFDYTTASGVEMTSDALNAIQVAPGLKIIYNAENGWQPYLGFNMVFNIMDSQKYYANNVALPQMSIDPYFEYGLGVQRRWGEKFTGFGKTMLRGGGRNGIALMFGFRLAIGK